MTQYKTQREISSGDEQQRSRSQSDCAVHFDSHSSIVLHPISSSHHVEHINGKHLASPCTPLSPITPHSLSLKVLGAEQHQASPCLYAQFILLLNLNLSAISNQSLVAFLEPSLDENCDNKRQLTLLAPNSRHCCKSNFPAKSSALSTSFPCGNTTAQHDRPTWRPPHNEPSFSPLLRYPLIPPPSKP